MNARTVKRDPLKSGAEALAVPVCEGDKPLGRAGTAVDGMAGGALTELLARRGWTGKPGQALPMLLPGKDRPRLIVAVGMGPRADVTLERCREAAALAVKQVSRLAIKSLALPVDDFTGPGRPAAVTSGALVEGAMLAGYTFRRYKTGQQDDGAKLEELLLVSASGAPALRASMDRARAVCEATMLARDLGNTPPNEMTPTRLAEVARDVCGRAKMRFKKLGRPEMEKLGMNALLAVAKGSAEAPVLLEMEIAGKGPRAKTLVLVGKGITFDSGGISLKPAENMDKMKYDMSGAAAVIATMKALAAIGTRHRVIGLVPACENLPGGTATRPGDIVRAMNGKTIEILNTDAEGRLILADALCYAARFKPAAIVDIATLTGAAVIALGDQCSAILGSDQPLMDGLVRAGERSGERLWQLPLWKPHLDEIRGEAADIKNTGGRPAGTIKGAAFLQHFVGDTPWAHLDIAATANVEKEKPLAPLGGTGVGVRLLTAFVEDWR